jgi:hypothetical protein
LTQSYELLIHLTFQKQALEVKKKHPEIEDALVTALQEIQANPTPGTMQGVVIKRLQGVIHKKHVGGNNGHRLIYLHPKGSKIVIPVFLSPEPRSLFSYEDMDWQGICEPFYDDYIKKNYKAFSRVKW